MDLKTGTPFRLADGCFALLRFILAAIFLWSGIAKFLEPVPFVVTIDAFNLVPTALLNITAFLIILLELIAGVGLLLNRKIALHITTGLIILFVVILIYGIQKEIEVDCGCFGSSSNPDSAEGGLMQALYRDFVILLGLITLYGKQPIINTIKKLRRNSE